MKKGFTLIELLGVIVLLALIMLMVFPTIINTIKKSNNSKDEIYKKLILSAAEDYVNENSSDFEKTDESNYCIVVNDLIDYGLFDEDELVDSKEILENKSVQVLYSDNKFSYNLINTSDCKSIRNVNRYKNGKVVYFDVKKGVTCTNYKENNSNTGYNGMNPNSSQNSCLKFYVFNDDGKDTVNLILDHNTTASVAWNSSGSNSTGPNELLSQLKLDTSSWEGTNTPSNYSIDQSSSTSKAKYTIDYTGYKARLITADEVAKITNNTSFNEVTTASNYFFFDTNTQKQSDTCKYGNTSGCKYGWLNDRTMKTCEDYSCLNNSSATIYGYWTISPTASLTNYAWYVYFLGYIQGTTITNKSSYGVRPVIEVNRKKINKKASNSYICKPVTTSLAGNVPRGNFDVGDEYVCYVNDTTSYNFYVISTSDNKINMIMDRNICDDGTPTTSSKSCSGRWSSDGNVTNGPVTAIEYLNSATSSWTNISNLNETYNDSGGKYTINLTGKARLPKSSEISAYSSSNRYLYNNFASSSAITGTSNIAGVYNYWAMDTSGSQAYILNNTGMKTSNLVSFTAGIRPVISVNKNNIKPSPEPICKGTTYVIGTTPTGKYEAGDIYTCKVNDTTSYNFYILNTDGDYVNLMMNRNICDDGTLATSSNTCTTPWISKEDYIKLGGTENEWSGGLLVGNTTKGPVTAIAYLNQATSSWTNIPSLNETYTDEGGKYGTINLTGRARLPKKSELGPYSDAVGFRFMYNYLKKFDTVTTGDNIEGIYGYWTLASIKEYTYYAWALCNNGTITRITPGTADSYGVRPVIKLLKSDLVN